MNVEKVHAHIDTMRERDLDTLCRLVAQPSVSSEGNGIRECAALLRDILEHAGIHAEVIGTEGNPVVYGAVMSKNPNAKTILFYGHYDVMPVDPLERWLSPPFEPTIRDGRVYARGSADNKGQFLAHVLAIRSYLASEGDVPVNVKIVLDGEEENGSPSLEGFVRAHTDMLKADIVYSADGPIHPLGVPEINHGVRGILCFDLELDTAKFESHSGRSGGIIRNPVLELIGLVAKMVDPDGHCNVEGFYDAVVPMTDYERTLIDRLPFSPNELAEIWGVDRLQKADRGSYFKQLMFSPTFTANGMVGGYIGSGSMACVPCSANVKFDLRLVERQDPYDIEEKIRSFVKRHNPDVRMTNVQHTYPSKSSVDLPISRTIVAAVDKFYPNPFVTPTAGGTMPEYVWTKILGIPAVMVPYGNADETNHAPNENLSLECYYRGIHITAEVMDAIAKM